MRGVLFMALGITAIIMGLEGLAIEVIEVARESRQSVTGQAARTSMRFGALNSFDVADIVANESPRRRICGRDDGSLRAALRFPWRQSILRS